MRIVTEYCNGLNSDFLEEGNKTFVDLDENLQKFYSSLRLVAAREAALSRSSFHNQVKSGLFVFMSNQVYLTKHLVHVHLWNSQNCCPAVSGMTFSTVAFDLRSQATVQKSSQTPCDNSFNCSTVLTVPLMDMNKCITVIRIKV